jgi:hypothetical protein
MGVVTSWLLPVCGDPKSNLPGLDGDEQDDNLIEDYETGQECSAWGGGELGELAQVPIPPHSLDGSEISSSID